MKLRQTDYGKGDADRVSDRKSFGEKLERIFGKKELPREFKRYSKVYGSNVKKNDSFFVPDMTPRFNHGLGMVTCGTRDAEQKAKKMGLTPIGDAKKSEIIPRQTIGDTITPILTDGLARIRAEQRRRS